MIAPQASPVRPDDLRSPTGPRLRGLRRQSIHPDRADTGVSIFSTLADAASPARDQVKDRDEVCWKIDPDTGQWAGIHIGDVGGPGARPVLRRCSGGTQDRRPPQGGRTGLVNTQPPDLRSSDLYGQVKRRFLPTSSRQPQSWLPNSQFGAQANRFSIFTGNSRTRTPVAWCTAAVTAAAKPARPISPMPRAPIWLIS
jgi:hypothetical protein